MLGRITKLAIILLAGLSSSPIQAQKTIHLKAADGEEGLQIIRETDQYRDIVTLNSYDTPGTQLFYRRNALLRYHFDSTISYSGRLYRDNFEYPSLTLASEIQPINADRYLQYATDNYQTYFSYLSPADSNDQYDRFRGTILNKNFVAQEDNLYFLLGKGIPYLRTENGMRYGLNYRKLNTDSMYMLRLNTDILRWDTLGFFRYPVDSPYREITEHRGLLSWNGQSDTFQFLKPNDTVLTYRFGQREPTDISPALSSGKFRGKESRLFLQPQDTVYRLKKYTPYSRPPDPREHLVYRTVLQNGDSLQRDSIILKTGFSTVISAYTSNYPALLAVDNSENYYLYVAGEKADTSRKGNTSYFLKFNGEGEFLWDFKVFEDSTFSNIRHLSFDKAGNLQGIGSVYRGSRYYSSRHHPVIVKIRSDGGFFARFEEEYQVAIYPNPSRGTVYLQSNHNWPQGGIYTLGGKKLRSFEYEKGQYLKLNLAGYGIGNYLIRVKDKQGREYTRKIVLR